MNNIKIFTKRFNNVIDELKEIKKEIKQDIPIITDHIEETIRDAKVLIDDALYILYLLKINITENEL